VDELVGAPSGEQRAVGGDGGCKHHVRIGFRRRERALGWAAKAWVQVTAVRCAGGMIRGLMDDESPTQFERYIARYIEKQRSRWGTVTRKGADSSPHVLCSEAGSAAASFLSEARLPFFSAGLPLNGISARGFSECRPMSQLTTAVADMCMALIVAAARKSQC
jgi:hypothetical protein